MNKKFSSIAVDAAVAAVGVVFLIMHATPDFVTWIARLIGAVFAIVAVASLIGNVVTARKREEPVGIANVASAVGALCFGVVLLLRGHLFVDTLGIIISVMVTAMGLYQLVTPVVMHKSMKIDWWLFLIPTLTIAAGVVMLTCNVGTQMIALLSGLCFVAFTADDLLQRHACTKKASATTSEIIADDPA